MTLKATLKDLKEIDPKFHELYEKDEESGQYVLTGVDDKDYKQRLQEFRDNNRLLNKERTEREKLLEKFKDVDTEKYKAGLQALEQLDKLEDKSLLDAGNLDAVIAKRTQTMRDDFESKLKAKHQAYEQAQQERDALRGRLGILVTDQAIQQAVSKVGQVRKGALDDVLYRARATWHIDDKGNMVPRDSKGEVAYGKDGSQLTTQEWAQTLLESAPHLFEPGQGGGAKGGSRGDGDGSNVKVIDGNDPVLFGKHLEDIAKGKVIVRS